MTSTNPLLNLHRIPRKIIIDNRITELKVQTFGTGIRANQNLRIVFEVIDNGMLIFDASTVIGFSVILYSPCLIDVLRHDIIEVSVKQKDVFLGISGLAQLTSHILLRTLGLSKYNYLLRNSGF